MAATANRVGAGLSLANVLSGKALVFGPAAANRSSNSKARVALVIDIGLGLRGILGRVVVIGVVAVLGAGLLAAAIFDRRARARGHQLRGVGSWYAVRESRRDSRAGHAQSWLNSDNDWTAGHRRDVDAEAQRQREDGD